MTDIQWPRIRSFLRSCSCIYTGDETRWHLFVTARCWMAQSGASWRRLPAEYGKWNSVYRRYYARGCDQGAWPRLMAYLQANPDLSAVLLDSTVVRARERDGRAPKGRDGSRAGSQPGRLQHPEPYLGGSTGPSPTSARDRRPTPRQYLGPGPGGNLNRRALVLPDRGPGLWPRRLPRRARATGHRSRPSGPAPMPELPALRPGTVPGAQRRRTGHRLAQRVAARGHSLQKYVHDFFSFPYLATAWIWMESNVRTP